MNDSLTARLICETKGQIRELEARIAFLDQQIPVVRGAVTHKRQQLSRAWLDLLLWDTMQEAYLAGNGPNPRDEMGDRTRLLKVWQDHRNNLKFLEELLAQYEAERLVASRTIEALRAYLALLEKDLFEFCHDQTANPLPVPVPPRQP